jgi:acetyltransferase-like isoleucine patch superfamily enzyme
MKPAITPQQTKLTSSSSSALSLYREYAAGKDTSLLFFLYYEFCMAFSGLFSLPGMAARSFLYPRLFAGCGLRPAFGRGVIVRGPKNIVLGDKVMLDDNAFLETRGQGSKIRLGDYVSIGRFTSVVAKDGSSISMGAGTNIGSYCRVATQSGVKIGDSVLVAAYCYIGPGNHQLNVQNQTLIESETTRAGGVEIGDHCWIGTRATILDGVKLGERSIVGAHSLVLSDVPPGTIVAGAPARVIKTL